MPSDTPGPQRGQKKVLPSLPLPRHFLLPISWILYPFLSALQHCRASPKQKAQAKRRDQSTHALRRQQVALLCRCIAEKIEEALQCPTPLGWIRHSVVVVVVVYVCMWWGGAPKAISKRGVQLLPYIGSFCQCKVSPCHPYIWARGHIFTGKKAPIYGHGDTSHWQKGPQIWAWRHFALAKRPLYMT